MAKLVISYWVLPIISGVVWFGMLLGLLLYWIVGTNRTTYPSMADSATIAYISDVGAYKLKPLFITGCVVTTIFLDLGFGADRWLRHKGRLVPNTSFGEKVLMVLTIVFAFIGTVGLVLLSVFDTANYPLLHNIFLLLFIAGYLLSAIFICWGYQRLGIKHREHRVLRVSFWIKLTFVLIELILAVIFVATTFTRRYDIGAIFEWVIAFVFTFYILSFSIDLYPAVYTKPRGRRHYSYSKSARKMEEGSSSGTLPSAPAATHAPGRFGGVPNNF